MFTLHMTLAARYLWGRKLRTVLTTLAPASQGYAERAVSESLQALAQKGRPPLDAGLVLTDTSRGEVLAMVGGRAADTHGFNRALQAQRPVGSLLKPFVYLLALAQPGRYSLASMVEDAPQDLVHVRLDDDLGLELIVRVEAEVGVRGAGVAVVAGVDAAAIGIERPPEGHPFNRVERGLARSFDVGRACHAPTLEHMFCSVKARLGRQRGRR